MGAKGDSKNKKSKKKRTVGPNAVVKKHKAQVPNPFETIWSRSKYDFLGKKRKGEERRIGLARSLAIDKRKKTLLKEYEQSGKASVFVDKRIGENDDELEEFDKAILRSQRERQMKVSKKSKYNLSDGEADDELDFGAEGGLLGRDDFQDDIEPEQDDEQHDAYPSKKTTNVRQIASGDREEGVEARHKSKKEMMEEIISKSKYHKELNRKAKEDNEQLMEQLDKEFETLVQSETMSSIRPHQMGTASILATNNMLDGQIKKDESLGYQTEGVTTQAQPDAYEKILKTMQLEMRARPSDRTKTPEEIAQEEKERLEKLEEERQKRMLATDDSSDDELGHEDVKHVTQKPRAISGDDLGDSFEINEEESKDGWVDAILQRKGSEDDESEDGKSSQGTGTDDDDSDEDGDDDSSGEDSGEYPISVSLKDWEQDDDADSDDDDNENLMSKSGKEVREERDNEGEGRKKDTGIALRKKKLVANAMGDKNTLSNQVESLPFTIEAPASFEELSKLLENRSDQDIIEAIRRTCKCNAIALKAENRRKMQVFYGLLLQYFAVSASRRPLNFQLLNSLASPLIEMSAEIPYFSAICARQRIMRTRMQLCDALKNQDRSCWPAAKTLFLLRLWSMIYPCSDFRHVVMTPATLLMCEYLMRCPIASGHDIAVGMFLCSMVLSVATIKIIRNKQTGQSEGYGFIEFLSRPAAEKALQTYNGSTMPRSEQSYRINWATFSKVERRSSTDSGSDLSIFVGDLAPDVTDVILQETFARNYQSVKGAKVVVDVNSGRSKGYGFVRFSDENERARAMTEMNGMYCLSRPMRLGVATPKKSAGFQQQQQQQYPSQAMVLSGGGRSNGAVHQVDQSGNDPNNTTIFVGGIDSETTDADLREPFSQFGDILNIKIPVGKGCAFVQFAMRSEAEAAIEGLNGTVIGNQAVRLSWGRNPANRQWRNDQSNQWNGGYHGGGQTYNGYGHPMQQTQDSSMYNSTSAYGTS